MRRAFSVVRVLVALAAFTALCGCKASVEGEVKTGKSEDIADFDKPMDAKGLADTRSSADTNVAETALLGARQDLAFSGGTAAKCKCLAVAVGQPTDAAFKWAGSRPTIDGDTQVVVGLSSAGVSCDAGPDASGASYWGYEVVGQDVVVVVESAKPGRPVAQGAIIPRPTGTGQIYVRPVDKTVPYGRPSSGAGDRCPVASMARPVAAAPPAAPASSGGWTIKTKESDPESPQTFDAR